MEALCISNAVPVVAAGIASSNSAVNSGKAAGDSFSQMVAKAAGQSGSVSAPRSGGSGKLGGNCVPDSAPKATAKSSGDPASTALNAGVAIVLVAPIVVPDAQVSLDQGDDPSVQESTTAAGNQVTTNSNADAKQAAAPQTAVPLQPDAQNNSFDLSMLAAAIEQGIVPVVQESSSAQSPATVDSAKDQLIATGVASQSEVRSAPPQNPGDKLTDPAVKSLAEQILKLQESGKEATSKTEKIAVMEVGSQPSASRMNAPMVTDLPKMPQPNSPAGSPVQGPDPAQLNALLKPEPANTVANNENYPTIPSKETQQKETAGQQSARQDSNGDASSTPEGTSASGFFDLVTKATKHNVTPLAAQDLSPRPDTPQDSAQAGGTVVSTTVHATVNEDQNPVSSQAAALAGNSGPNWRTPDDSAGKVVNSAQLAEAANHTEMRIAMQTDRLGNIELRAHVAGETVGAAITVEKRDAHSALAAELPALQQALSEKSLRVDHVELYQSSLNLGDSQSGREMSQEQAQQMQQRGKGWSPLGTDTLVLSAGIAQAGVFDSSGRLNVRA